MSNRDSLFSNRCVLLGIKSAQGVDAIAKSAERRCLGVIIPGQMKRLIFRMFFQIRLSRLCYLCNSLHMITALVPPMESIKRETSAPLEESTRKFKIVFTPSHAIHTNKGKFDLLVPAGFVVRCVEK